MTSTRITDISISRRHWVLLAASTLAGCGGADLAALPGTGGTGIFAQGAITGFGSVIVNGIKFDDFAAVVQLNGVAATASDLRLGMVAEIRGQRGADAALGTASEIAAWSIAQGQVERVQAGQFVVAGMAVQTDSATVFDGISTAAGLANGMAVAVWGLQAGADGSRWTATRIAVLSAKPSAVISTGLVGGSDMQRIVNGLPMSGSTGAMVPGQLLRVQGSLSGASLHVDAYRVVGLSNSATPQDDFKIEGLVTSVLSATRWMLGNQEVDTSTVVQMPPAGTIAVGARIEVHGSLQGQVLKATTVEVQTELKLDHADIEARIEQFTSLANFVVRGQRCDATAAVITKGSAADLKVGVRVKLSGTKAGDVLRVTTLEINP
jgi:hypothetical protein